MIKKSFLFIAAAVAVMTGCSKEEISEMSAGVPMTINVAIENAATRTTYAADGGAIKVRWEAGDQVSVVSFGSDNVARTCDTFTTAEGGSSASFTGTYTGAADANLIKVFYPALTATGSIHDVTGWVTPSIKGQYTSWPRFAISNSGIYCRINFNYVNQWANDDPSHLKYFDSMSAAVSSTANLSDVTLAKHSSVIKLVIDISSIPDGSVIKYVGLRNTDFKSRFDLEGWAYAYSDVDFARTGAYTSSELGIYLGTNETGTGGNSYVTGFVKNAGENSLVVYMPHMGGTKLSAGEGYTISVGTGTEGMDKYVKTITLPRDLVITMGTCYTIYAKVAK